MSEKHGALTRLKGKSPVHILSVLRRMVSDPLVTGYYKLRYPHVQWGRGVLIRGRLIVQGKGQIVVGDGCEFGNMGRFPNKLLTFDEQARIIIGNGCFLNGAELACRIQIELGPRCIVGDCHMMDTDFHSVEINRWEATAPVKSRAIQIGHNVWLANHTVVLKGVVIGDNSVVGSGTIVRQSVPANVVVLGNPQQIVKELVSSDQQA